MKLCRGVLRLCAVVLAIYPALAAGQGATYRSGQTIQLAPDVKLNVVAGSLAAFKAVTVSDVAQVVELRFDAGEDSARWLYLQPWKDPATSGVVLVVGDTRIAPEALTMTGGGVRRPEVTKVKDLLATRTGRALWMPGLAGRPTVHLLFDVPANSAGKPMTLSIDLGLDGKPTPITVVMGKQGL
jgi:hypothetical protein